MTYVSISARILVNLDGLNNVESVGSYVRHRKAPVIVFNNSKYELKYVPVISGEALGHAFQECIVDVAERWKLPIGYYSRRREFIKFADDKIVQDEGLTPPKSIAEIPIFELDVLSKDIVADIGGFLYLGDIPVKRTSTFKVGYMIPAFDNIDVAILDPQQHARHVSMLDDKRDRDDKADRDDERDKDDKTNRDDKTAPPQMIYYRELGSALYTFRISIDIDKVSKPVNTKELIEKYYNRKIREKMEKMKKEKSKKEIEEPSNEVNEMKNLISEWDKRMNALQKVRNKRIKALLYALLDFFSNLQFGAGRSRWDPDMKIQSIVAVVSDNARFEASYGNYKGYIRDTVERARMYLEARKQLGDRSPKISIFFFDNEGSYPESAEEKDGIIIQRCNSVEEVIKRVIEKVSETQSEEGFEVSGNESESS